MVTKENSNMVVELEVSGQDTQGLETVLKGIIAATFYGVCSVSSAIVSKALMDTLAFDFPVTIMVAQMVLTIAVLEFLNYVNVITIPSYTLKRGLSFFWPSLFYGVNSVLALSALAHMNIAMYGVLKRCVPISTMILSTVILKQGCPSRWTMVTVSLLSIGCVIAGYGDLTFNFMAYSCGIGSNFTQALYLLLVQLFSQQHKLSTTETLQLNSFNTLPFLLLFTFVNGELSQVGSYPVAEHPYFFLAFFVTISVGMLLNYSLFLCTGLTSALTTSVVGGLKAMVQTILGIVTFGGVSENLPTYLGIALNLVGGFGYIAVKYKEINQKLQGKGIHKVMSLSAFNGKGPSVLINKDNKGEAITGFLENIEEYEEKEEEHQLEFVLKERTHSITEHSD